MELREADTVKPSLRADIQTARGLTHRQLVPFNDGMQKGCTVK